MVLELLKAETIQLAVADICRLHRTLMESTQVLDSNRRHDHEIIYTSIGVTRSICRSNVSAQANFGGTSVKVQFCPYDEVDAQLAIFCQRFNVSCYRGSEKRRDSSQSYTGDLTKT